MSFADVFTPGNVQVISSVKFYSFIGHEVLIVAAQEPAIIGKWAEVGFAKEAGYRRWSLAWSRFRPLLQGFHVGEQAVIGVGSAVIRDVEPNVLAVGNPCKVKMV